MFDRHLLRILFGLCIMSFAVTAQEEFEEYCCLTPSTFRAGIRHIESKGIGYKEGYTTLEALVSPFSQCYNFVPLLDVRGHIFNNGKFAANAGIGGRFWSGCQIFGFNAFYDFRKTERKNANQVGAGFEWIGTLFEARVNGYAAIGRRRTGRFKIGFQGFEGHHILLKNKRQTSLQGADAELGVRCDGFCNTHFFLGAGPYYLKGKNASHVWGGQARLTGRFRDVFCVTVSTSYDSMFKNIVQGEIGFTIPFGPRKSRNCCSLPAFENRLVQPIIRHEIIPIGTVNQNSVAINPVTGLPYEVWFVDSTGTSNGTFESPFHTITAAMNASSPHDIIYIFPGNGQAYDEAVVLKNSQRIYGSADPHVLPTQFGDLTIPAIQSPRPLLTNAAGDVITLANNNEVSGLHIIPTNVDAGIVGTAIIHANIHQNAITTGSGDRIVLNDVRGAFFINDNLFSCPIDASSSITINGITNADFVVHNNQSYKSTIFFFMPVTGGKSRLDIADNMIQAENAILVFNTGNSDVKINVMNNDIIATFGVFLNPTFPATMTSYISHNSIDATLGVLSAGNVQTTSVRDNTIHSVALGIILQRVATSGDTISFHETISHNHIVCDTGRAILIQEASSAGTTLEATACITHNHMASPNPTTSIFTSGSGGTTTLCLKYQNNIGLPESTVELTGIGTSEIELEPYIFNNSTLVITPGTTVINVPAGTCGCSQNL